MKICMISTYPPRKCGIADYVYDLSRAMAKQDVKVEIITYREPNTLAQEEMGPSIRVHRILNGVFSICLKCWKKIEGRERLTLKLCKLVLTLAME